MFEQAFRNIYNVVHKVAGCTTELDCTEQTSWLLFLQYLEGWRKIQRMGNAGRNGGEYYTPRPLIRAIVQLVQPQNVRTTGGRGISHRRYDRPGRCLLSGL